MELHHRIKVLQLSDQTDSIHGRQAAILILNLETHPDLKLLTAEVLLHLPLILWELNSLDPHRYIVTTYFCA